MSEPSAALTKSPKDVFALLSSSEFKEKLTQALPNRAIQSGVLTPGRLVQLARTMIQGNSSLAKCSPISIMACVIECAQLGLELDKILGHAYLVPFAGECTLIVGYRGFMHLAYQSGAVGSISAEVVRKSDKFHYSLGTKRVLSHIPNGIPKGDDSEKWLGAYAAVNFLSGVSEFEYLERAKIEAARNRSRSWHAWLKEKKSTPWVTDTEEMWRKTAIRRLSKRLPLSTTDKRAELLRAVLIDEYGERKGLLVPTLHGFEVNENPPEPDDPDPVAPTEQVAKAPEAKPEKKISAKGKSAEGVPKANIPPAAKPSSDPTIGTKEQTDVFNTGTAHGWTVDAILSYLKKNYKVNSINQIRTSQLPELLRVMKEGT